MTRIQTIFLAVSALAFAGAGQALAYATLVAPKKQAAADLAAMTQALGAERAASAAVAADGSDPTVAEISLQPRSLSVPQLLSQVQEIALKIDVRVTDLAPVEPGSSLFRAGMSGAYPDLVRFLARFEALPVEIVELQMGGGEAGATPVAGDALSLSLVFSRGSSAPALSLADAAAFEVMLRDEAPRNPFQPWNGAVAWAPESTSADLTWIHHLSGVSEIGETRIATIDNRDYRVGDRLAGRTIAAIGADSVTLSQAGPEGEQTFMLGFRYVLGARN